MTEFDLSNGSEPVPDQESLRRLALRGASITILAQAAGVVVQMVATIILARLLTPADFGLVTMVTTFSLLFTNFGLNGITEAVVQNEELTRKLASNLFWISIGAGILLTGVFAQGGSLLAKFYRNPHINGVAIGLSSTIFFTCASVLHLALLKRSMRFAVLSANDLVGRIISVLTSLVLAWNGAGYWAIVGGTAAQALSTCIGAWILCRWVPQLPTRAAGTLAAVKFALNVYGFFGLNYIKRNVDNLLVGWYFGPGVLGLYKKAYDLFYLPMSAVLSPISSSAVPALCRMTADRATSQRYLLQSFSILAFLGMGLSGFLTLAGRDVTLVLLGPKWAEAGMIFMFFAPGVGAMFLQAPWGWITLSTGRVERYSRWGLVDVLVTGALFIVALPWGPRGIAAAWSASYWLLVVPATWYAGRPIQFGVIPVLRVIWRYIAAAIFAGFTCLVLERRMSLRTESAATLDGIWRIAQSFVLFGSIYSTTAIVLHGGFEPIEQITRLLPDLSSRFKRSERALNAA